MTVKTNLNSAMNDAFKALSSMTEPVTFKERATTSFDWSLGEPVSTETSASGVDGILIVNSSTDPDVDATLIVRSGDVTPSAYNDVIVGGTHYNVKSYRDNKFVVKFILARDR